MEMTMDDIMDDKHFLGIGAEPNKSVDSETCMEQIVSSGNTTRHLIYEGYGGIPENLVINAVGWLGVNKSHCLVMGKHNYISLYNKSVDSETCMEQIVSSGNTTRHLIYEGYGGIPENLVINAVGWLVDSETCMEQIISSGNTTRHLIYEGYGGIPENLVINAMGWLVLMIIFAILRRVAWDYGRIALVSRNEEKWTSLFYGDHEGNRHHGSLESLDTQIHAQDKGFLTWIIAFIKVKDSDILNKCGQDALQYITFQRYLLVYVTIVTVLSTAIIIPVNFTGNLVGNATDFGHTTIANLDSESSLLWIHVILSLVYMVLALLFMRHFSNNLKFEQDDQVSRTLMIANVPKDKCSKNLILQHFQEGYPEIVVEDVTFAYDVEKLIELDRKRMVAVEAKMNSELELQKTGKRPTLRPYKCGQCLCCGDSCGCIEVDAISHYSDEAAELKELCEKEKVTAFQRPLGVAFVTFENMVMAERIKNDFQPSCKASQNPTPSTVHNTLDVVEWNVLYAPSPRNIYWEKLAMSGWKWWVRAIILNTILVILLFFLTTPTIVLSTLDRLHYKDYLESTVQNAVILQFLPTLLLWTFTALLPNIVYYSDQYVGHWTKTSEHHAVMRKTFVFLLLMVLILPSLGLTSAKALFSFFIVDKEKDLKWSIWSLMKNDAVRYILPFLAHLSMKCSRCIFLAGNGAFFVNYVITSAFIGTGLELLRFSELFVYVMKLLLAKSSAERTSVRKHVLWEYQYGIQYAWNLCVFATVMSYSISCPLITPFGLVYMLFKHVVDRYNIYFAYKPSHISQNIHATAINMVIVAVVFLQFNLVFFSVIRGGSDNPKSIFAIMILAITLMFFFLRVSFGCFKDCGPCSDGPMRKYKQFSQSSSFIKTDEDSQKFVAGVLANGNSRSSEAISSMSANQTLTQSYGTMDTRQEPAVGHVTSDTDNNGYQPSYTHDS